MKRYLKKITLAAAAMFAASCIWAQDSPGNLVYNEIDDSPVAGNCGTMVDGTTFSSPTFATIPVTHASIEDVEFYGERKGFFKINENYTEAFDNGNFGSGLDYAIVSNPQTLNAAFRTKDDGKNRLIFSVGHNSDGDSDLLFTYSAEGFEPNSTVRLMFTVEDVTSSGFKQIKYTTNSNTAFQFSDFSSGTGTFTYNTTATASGKASFTFYARLASQGSAYAISDLKVYGCAVPDVDSDLPVDVIADGESCTLYAYGLANYSGEYIWYRSASSEGPWEEIGRTAGNSIAVTPEYGDNYYYCVRGGAGTATYKLISRVECGDPENMKQIWNEDFGQVPEGTRVQNEHVLGHVYQAGGKVEDGNYCVVGNSNDAAASDCAWIEGQTDHTGLTGDGTFGGFLVVNIAAEPGDIIYQQDITTGDDDTEALCPNQYYFFSAYVMNPNVYGDREPCNVSFSIMAQNPENEEEWVEIGYGESGSIPSGNPEWVLAGGSFNSGNYNRFRITMTALSEGSWGNDIFVDDISFALCAPEISLPVETISGGCGDMVDVAADVTASVDRFFADGEAYCLWQSTTSRIGRNWETLDQSGNNVWTISVEATETATYYRLVVADDEEAAKRIAENGGSDDSCEVFVITNRANVECSADCEPPVIEIDGTITAACPGSVQTINTKSTGSAPAYYIWEQLESDGVTWTTLEESGNSLTVSPEKSTTYRVSAYTNWTGTEGCTSEPVEVTVPVLTTPDFTLQVIRPTDEPTCANGTVSAHVVNIRANDIGTNDNISGDVSWKWFVNDVEDPSITTASKIFRNVSETTEYKVIASNACYTHEITSTLVFIGDVEISTPPQDVCAGSEITLQADGGDEGYYEWGTRPAGSSDDWTILEGRSSSITVTVDAASEYMVRSGQGSCWSNEASVTIGTKAETSVTVTPAESSIEQGESVILTAETSGGTVQSIVWYKDGEIIEGENGLTISITPDKTSTYTVGVTDDCGEKTADAIVNVHIPCTPVELRLDASSTELCPGESATLSAVILNSVEVVEYRWQQSPDGIEWTDMAEAGASLSVSPSTLTYYNVVAIPEDAECTSEIQTAVIDVLPQLQAELSATPSGSELKQGEELELTVNVTNGNADSFTWSRNGSILDENGNMLTDIPAGDTRYEVTVSDRCTNLLFSHDVIVKFPTIFTPFTREGSNDVFMQGCRITIFDRYGNNIAECTDGWDGSTANGTMVQPGVYFYVLYDDGGTVIHRGSVEAYK